MCCEINGEGRIDDVSRVLSCLSGCQSAGYCVPVIVCRLLCVGASVVRSRAELCRRQKRQARANNMFALACFVENTIREPILRKSLLSR